MTAFSASLTRRAVVYPSLVTWRHRTRTTSRTLLACDMSLGTLTVTLPQAGDFVELLEPCACREDLCLPASIGTADGNFDSLQSCFRIPVGGKIFRASADGPRGPPTLLRSGHRFFFRGVKKRVLWG